MLEGWNSCCLIASYCLTFTADCGVPPPPVNGFLLQPHTNTTEGLVVVFQCDLGFVPEGEMTAVCGRDGQWTPNPGGVTCSPRPTPTFTQTPTQASIVTPSATPDFTGPGESQFQDPVQTYRNSFFGISTITWILTWHGITLLQDLVMKEATSLPCVLLVLPSQQLSPVLLHSSLEHWLELWYTTVLWGRNVIAKSATPWQ